MEEMYVVEENIRKHLEDLQKISSTPSKGVTRLPFSKEGKKAAEYLKKEMEKAGLRVAVDLVGNIRGRLEAKEKDAQTILIGSHYDTVKNGGAYDGIAGVVCGIEIARLIKRLVLERKYAIEVIAFNDEEGMMFGSGCLGSKALTGQVDENDINHLTDENGISIREWMLKWGSDPKEIDSLKLDLNTIRAFFEIHIEQGPVLDDEKKDIGIVECIVGLLRCMVTIEGRADHAGTTPMHMRKDAIQIGSKVISRLDEFANGENNGSVATCGFVRAYPNAMNVIAEKMEFTMDIRSKEQESIDKICNKVWKLLEQYTKEAGASFDVDIKLLQKPVSMQQRLVEVLERKCKKHQYEYKRMVSGAAHDAMIFADKVDTVMVFVPSKDGRSHCPEEFSKCSDLAKAVQIVTETIEDMMQE